MDRGTAKPFKLDPYASLLQSLLPSAKCYGLFDAAGGKRWIDAHSHLSELREEWLVESSRVVERLGEKPGGVMAPISDGHVVYVFPLGDGARLRLGTLVVLEQASNRGKESVHPIVSRISN